ncbi:MAG: aldo/keto reductase [Candidatus Bathyarchaeia archaeon]
MSYANATRVVRRAFESGINFFDIASVYGNGLSEERIVAAFKDVREQCV